MSFTEEVQLTWLGGRDIELVSPSWWESTYTDAKARWIAKGGELQFRFHASRPMGGVGNVSGHAAGVVVNLFTGLSLETPQGHKTLVTRAFNTFSPVWTMQDGIYDTDVFPGDFSVNFQILLQGQKITFQRGEPFASLLVFSDIGDTPMEYASEEETLAREAAAQKFYTRKGAGCPYHINLKQ